MSQEQYTNDNLIYGDWFRAKKKVVNLSGKEVREKAHNRRQPYCLTYLENDGETPYCFLEINNKAFFVGFLDSLKRLYLSYSFHEDAPDKLFLYKATYFEYEKDTDTCIKMTDYTFSNEGDLKIIKTNNTDNTREILDAKNKIDVSTHWEDYPEFGKYEKLIIKDRSLPG